MSLSDIHKTKAQRVMGIDCSTKSIAFTIFDGENFLKCGEVFFHGATVFERVHDANVKTLALFENFSPDFVAIEAAIMVRSTSVAIKMAYVFGAVIAALLKKGATVIEVPPISWQSFIGNKNLTLAEKNAIKNFLTSLQAGTRTRAGKSGSSEPLTLPRIILALSLKAIT